LNEILFEQQFVKHETQILCPGREPGPPRCDGCH